MTRIQKMFVASTLGLFLGYVTGVVSGFWPREAKAQVVDSCFCPGQTSISQTSQAQCFQSTNPNTTSVAFVAPVGGEICTDGTLCGSPCARYFQDFPAGTLGINGYSQININNGNVVLAAGGSYTADAYSIRTGTSVGAFQGTFSGLSTTGTNFGVYLGSAITTTTKFANVSCVTTTTVGVGTTGTLIIKDITGASTLCTPYSGNFNCAATLGTPQTTATCNASLTSAHVYAFELTGCGTFPTGLDCVADVTTAQF
jgi:hypothetical protein